MCLGCSRPEPVATWQGGTVNRQDYESWLRYTEVLDRPGAIKEMILVEYLAQAARDRGLDDEPAIQIEIKKARYHIFWAKLREHVYLSVSVEDQEIMDLQKKYPDAFKKPRKMQLSNIFLNGSDDPSEMAGIRAKLEKIRAELLEGADFETLARRESQSQTRFSGGKLGLLDPANLPGPVSEAVSTLEEGEISEIVETELGLSIFLCQKVQEKVIPTQEEVEAKLRTNLTRLRGKENWENTLQQMRDAIELPDSLMPSDGFLELPGFRMSTEELDALVAMQMKGIAAAKVPHKRMKILLTNWCTGMAMEKKGLELEFDREQDVSDKLYWKTAQTLAGHELATRVSKRVEQPDAEEIEAYFKANPTRYRHPPEFLMRVIYFGGEDKTGATVRMADEVFRKIEKGELTFAKAAERYSKDPSARNGGQLDWVPITMLTSWGPKLVQAIRHMEPGDRTGVFRLQSGIWIFELVDFRDYRPMVFEEVTRKVAVDCYNHRALETEEVLRKEILEGLSIRIHSEKTE